MSSSGFAIQPRHLVARPTRTQTASTDILTAMVSHAEVAENSRRAPSVTSRSSRHHHQRNRSHHGGTSYTPQNEFPFFAQSGDVEIVVECDGQEKRYLLHRLMLAQFSGFFDAGTSQQWSRTQATRDVQQRSDKKSELALSVIGEEATSSDLSAPIITADQVSRSSSSRRRWRYELNWAEAGEDEEPILTERAPQGSSFAPSPIPPPLSQQRPKPTQQASSHTHAGSFFRSVASLAIHNPSHHSQHGSQSVANLSAPRDSSANITNPLVRDYDNLFRIFYNFSPVLNTTNIASAYSECKALLALADMYDALLVVGPRIEHHLLAFGSRLFKQIAKYPPSYLKLGYLARSKVIFSEAMTHVVGQWPAAYFYLKPPVLPSQTGQGMIGGGYEVPLAVLDLIEDKVDELEEIISKIESKLFRLTLTTNRGERVNPSNDYLGWLAMSLFRQWIAENTTPEIRGILKNTPTNPARPDSRNETNPRTTQAQLPTTGSNPSSTRIYRLLSSTNTESYLSHDELKRFLKLSPTPPSGGSSIPFSSNGGSTALYTRDNLRRFERKMTQLKHLARDVVKPLTKNTLELDIRLLTADSNGQEGGGGLGYLVCMGVDEGELPWT